jgi:hypothetical protein
MNAAEFYLGRLELQNILLAQALQAAKTRIRQDRDCLYQCHYDPVAEDVIDAHGRAGLEEYDQVLEVVDRALQAATKEPPFEGLVTFEYTRNGWRVVDYEESQFAIRPLPLSSMWVFSCTPFSKPNSVLVIYGTFHRRPRRNTYCKRPHKEIVHA